MKHSLLIGIDGGGTHSTAAAAWPDGRIAAVTYGEGLNFHNIGVEPVRLRLEKMVAALCEEAGAPAECVCVGMSALDGPADDATLRRFACGTLSVNQLDLQSDADIALTGFTCGAPGMIVICGTGSMLAMVDSSGQRHVSGGWGYLLSDAGSGYTLAREGVLAVIDAHEGLGGQTLLTGDALRFFGVGQPRQMIDCIYDPGFTPEKLAGFARSVLARAVEGDAPALSLLRRNMDRLARLAAQMIARDPAASRVGLYGGIFANSSLARSLFTDSLTALSPAADVCRLSCPPELGAIIHLMQRGGPVDSDAVERLVKTYKEYSHECD